jgi:hypothetical protein
VIDDINSMAARRRDDIDRAGDVGWHPRPIAEPDHSQDQRDELAHIKQLAVSAAKLSVRVKELGCWFPIDGTP